ncbi:unnamed protein product [Rotaria socialis]|uniref:Transposase n=1 Tax=Rotaria socialis TaxID=392032 RepID=A0A821TRE0_9BILA|nr:unnamed protein product [Rotaria socialis]CAF3641612.1 unnamed protein product [Rotaria socialis]CAF4866944.1 unnamed protein product [Rotaria socialis]CAF4878517.1 unnamed protein product [Rotaria socialis]
MTRKEREALAKRVCNFYEDAASRSVKTTVSFFKKQNIPERTIRYILKKYLVYGTTHFLPRNGRPHKLSDKKVDAIVKSINNKTGVSQCEIARHYKVHHSTICRTLKRRTSVIIRKRKKAPKMNNYDQEKRAQVNCGKLYRLILNGCDIIMDDEKYFGLSGDNVQYNQRYYTTNPLTTPTDVKYKKKKKYSPKLLVWMAISSKGVPNIYVHKSVQAIGEKIYLNECINKRLLPFIEKHHKNDNYVFWPDKASAHYATSVLNRLKEKNVPIVHKLDNPPNVPQARPIETVWSLLEQKVYEHNWQAKSIDSLARRIRKKSKELEQNTLQAMIGHVRKKLRSMWRNGLYSIF